VALPPSFSRRDCASRLIAIKAFNQVAVRLARLDSAAGA